MGGGKSDDAIVFYASSLPYLSILNKFIFGSLAVIAIFRFTSDFLDISGH